MNFGEVCCCGSSVLNYLGCLLYNTHVHIRNLSPTTNSHELASPFVTSGPRPKALWRPRGCNRADTSGRSITRPPGTLYFFDNFRPWTWMILPFNEMPSGRWLSLSSSMTRATRNVVGTRLETFKNGAKTTHLAPTFKSPSLV